MPAWNVFGILFDLLSFGEERRITRRDSHGRFVAHYSPKLETGLLEEPIFNNAVAQIVAAALGMARGSEGPASLEGQVRAPAMILSHDCDMLRGNDRWTQAIRGYRTIAPLARGRLPRPGNLWWMLRNSLRSRDFYLDNISGIVTLESLFGYRSTFYLLNGKAGRFGARSGLALLPQAIEMIPHGWEIGLHYNYDTHLEPERLQSQVVELEQVTGRSFSCGRAHYLRFDPDRSPVLYESAGMGVDESAGYSDRIGYRCGVGGGFQLWDAERRQPRDLVEVPLVLMDTTLEKQYRNGAPQTAQRLLEHLGRVGGALSLIYHPGYFFNPEFPRHRHLYHQLLQAARSVGATSITASALAARYSEPLPSVD